LINYTSSPQSWLAEQDSNLEVDFFSLPSSGKEAPQKAITLALSARSKCNLEEQKALEETSFFRGNGLSSLYPA